MAEAFYSLFVQKVGRAHLGPVEPLGKIVVLAYAQGLRIAGSSRSQYSAKEQNRLRIRAQNMAVSHLVPNYPEVVIESARGNTGPLPAALSKADTTVKVHRESTRSSIKSTGPLMPAHGSTRKAPAKFDACR